MDIKQELIKLFLIRNKTKLQLILNNLAMWTVALIICLIWYDFKLFIIIWLMLFANNIQSHINKKYNQNV